MEIFNNIIRTKTSWRLECQIFVSADFQLGTYLKRDLFFLKSPSSFLLGHSLFAIKLRSNAKMIRFLFLFHLSKSFCIVFSIYFISLLYHIVPHPIICGRKGVRGESKKEENEQNNRQKPPAK